MLDLMHDVWSTHEKFDVTSHQHSENFQAYYGAYKVTLLEGTVVVEEKEVYFPRNGTASVTFTL